MNPLDAQIEAVTAILRKQGATVGIDSGAPDYVKMAFLEMLLNCPDCREEMMGKHNGTAN